MNVGVLVSGSGTNLQALIDRGTRNELGPARLTVVGCNVPDCPALSRARLAGLPTFIVDHRDHGDRAAFDRALVEALRAHQVDLVVLAGFMRVLSGDLLDAFPGRVINIHPALLPAFPGVHGVKQAYDAAVKIAGCTVHFVDRGVDTGPIIAQVSVPVLDDDTEQTLTERIKVAERAQLVEWVGRLVREGWTIENRKVRIP